MNNVDACIDGFRDEVKRSLPRWATVSCAREMRDTELAVHAAARQVADRIVESISRGVIENPKFQAATLEAARRAGRYRGGERRPVGVRLLGGTLVHFRVPYLKPNRRGLRGRRRGVGRRGRSGSGLFPALAALGICFGLTPALAGDICRQVADSDSVRTGREALDRRGIDLGHKQTLRVLHKVGSQAVQQRDAWLQTAALGSPRGGPLAGKRVVVSTDGGRIRERVPAVRGRRRASGHRRFDAPWREPKMITIYTIDEQGEVDHDFPSVYDGSLGDCDATFELLISYLILLGAGEARELVIVGDGAKWIWQRISALVQRLGIDPDRIREVIDWYHAVETLHTIVAVPARWSQQARASWINRAKRHLFAGRVEKVVEMIEALAVGRRATAILEHRDYFAGNATRMQYAKFRQARIPLGSGAMESAIRRVVNMRMKGNGTFWLQANADGMLLLRSYLKAGRFDDLILWSAARAAHWWTPNQHHAASPIRELQAAA